MYSPKIDEKYIPLLYKLGKSKHKPMTHLVNEAVEQYLKRELADTKDLEELIVSNKPRRDFGGDKK